MLVANYTPNTNSIKHHNSTSCESRVKEGSSMSNELKPPIFLFGNTRSGTTIVQKVMSTRQDIAGWYEPNALWLYADPGRIHDEFDESDATKRVKRYIRQRFLKYQEQHGNCVVLEKTPQNILRIPYVRAIFPEAAFLFIVRNPFSFISSVELKVAAPCYGKWNCTALKRHAHEPVTSLGPPLSHTTVQQTCLAAKVLVNLGSALQGYSG